MVFCAKAAQKCMSRCKDIPSSSFPLNMWKINDKRWWLSPSYCNTPALFWLSSQTRALDFFLCAFIFSFASFCSPDCGVLLDLSTLSFSDHCPHKHSWKKPGECARLQQLFHLLPCSQGHLDKAMEAGTACHSWASSRSLLHVPWANGVHGCLWSDVFDTPFACVVSFL